MSTDIRSDFIIDRLPNAPDHWYVDWTKLGPVEKDIAKAKLCEIVFDKVKPKYQIGIGYNVQHYRPKSPDMLWARTLPRKPNDPVPEQAFELEEFTKWEVRWISYEGWIYLQDRDYEQWAYHLFGNNRTVATGIILETLDQCELFVDAMEAQFTFYMLKRQYFNDR